MKSIPLRAGHCKTTATRSENTSTVMVIKSQTISFGDIVSRVIETPTIKVEKNSGNVIVSDPVTLQMKK